MIALLIGGPHDGLMVTVSKGHSWLTDDGELRLPRTGEDDGEFAIYAQVINYGAPGGKRHEKGAYRFSRYWTRPEELT